MMRLKYLPMDFARLVCAPLLLVYRMKKICADGTPYKKKIEGGAIVVANHNSLQDPFLAGTAIWYRRMFFLAAEAVMKGNLKYTLLHAAGVIKIDRNITDIEAIRESVEHLKNGHLLTIFPQGKIEKNTPIEELKSGSVLIALQANVPIIPMYIAPRKHWYSRRRAFFAETIHPQAYVSGRIPTAKNIKTINDILTTSMKELGELA